MRPQFPMVVASRLPEVALVPRDIVRHEILVGADIRQGPLARDQFCSVYHDGRRVCTRPPATCIRCAAPWRFLVRQPPTRSTWRAVGTSRSWPMSGTARATGGGLRYDRRRSSSAELNKCFKAVECLDSRAGCEHLKYVASTKYGIELYAEPK